MDYLIVLFWSMIGSVFSLIGGILLINAAKYRENFVRHAMPFGAGAMLSAALLGLMPEAMHELDAQAVAIWMLLGFLIFFALERGISWFHHHHHDDVDGAKDKAHTSLVIVGDTVHNAIDGVALGAAFLVNPAAGVGAAIAIAAHEIPQEIGDFGILLAKGVSVNKAIVINVVSALATVVTAMVTFWLGRDNIFDVSPLLAIAAGFFVYIAAADIIPDIHERPHKEAFSQSLWLFLGVIVIGFIIISTAVAHTH